MLGGLYHVIEICKDFAALKFHAGADHVKVAAKRWAAAGLNIRDAKLKMRVAASKSHGKASLVRVLLA